MHTSNWMVMLVYNKMSSMCMLISQIQVFEVWDRERTRRLGIQGETSAEVLEVISDMDLARLNRC